MNAVAIIRPLQACRERIKIKGSHDMYVPTESDYNRLKQYLLQYFNITRRRTIYRDYVLLRCIAELGFRIDEALSLKVQDFDFERNYVKIYQSKQGKERTAYLNQNLQLLLIDYFKRFNYLFVDEYIFFSQKKKLNHVSKHRIEAVFKQYVKGAGLYEINFVRDDGGEFHKHSPHSWRRFFCQQIRLKNPTAPLDKLALVTGHKNLDVLRNFYIRLDAKEVQKEIVSNTF